MATRSMIWLRNGKNYKGIYCHFDGYLDFNGKMLVENYTTKEKVEELINLGAISCLRININPTGNHSFDNPEENVVISYHRDRGEELEIDEFTSAFNSIEETFYIKTDYEYQYIFDIDTNHWFLKIDNRKIIDLTDADNLGIDISDSNIDRLANYQDEVLLRKDKSRNHCKGCFTPNSDYTLNFGLEISKTSIALCEKCLDDLYEQIKEIKKED